MVHIQLQQCSISRTSFHSTSHNFVPSYVENSLNFTFTFQEKIRPDWKYCCESSTGSFSRLVYELSTSLGHSPLDRVKFVTLFSAGKCRGRRNKFRPGSRCFVAVGCSGRQVRRSVHIRLTSSHFLPGQTKN